MFHIEVPKIIYLSIFVFRYEKVVFIIIQKIILRNVYAGFENELNIQNTLTFEL